MTTLLRQFYKCKRICGVVLVLLALFFAFSVHASGEKIDLFSTDITIHKDSTVSIVETIKYDFGGEQRHGIFRYIPTTHTQPATAWYLNRYIGMDMQSVTRDGQTEQFTQSNSNNQIYLKIGSPGSTITGVHAYTIAYTLRGALLSSKDNGTELYWNVTGNQWLVPILLARARLYDPDGVLTKQRSCYRGLQKGNTPCAISDSEKVHFFEAQNLAPKEGMTIANAVDSSKVTVKPLERIKFFGLTSILIGLCVVWLIGLDIYVYFFRTHYRSKRSVVAQYEPYEGVLPMYTGVLVDGELDPKDITAGIVYLAQQGYIHIRKTEKKALFLFEVDDYEIVFQKFPNLPQHHATLIELLFRKFDTVGQTVALSEIKWDFAQKQENGKIIRDLQKSFKSDLVQDGFYEELSSKKLLQWSGAMLAVSLLGGWFIFQINTLNLNWGIIIITGVLTSICIGLMSRRLTAKGYEAVNYLKGFKLFLKVTDKERFDFHNAPQKSPEQFMEYLPYAIAFGVEEQWAKVFEGITIPAPSWYEGDVSTFSALNLTQSLGGFSTAFASSSGSSASSGGGFSGGGGGGGGGGSW